MAKWSGLTYSEMLEAILKATEQRLGLKTDEKKDEEPSKITLPTVEKAAATGTLSA
jgi:hypothetical protein